MYISDSRRCVLKRVSILVFIIFGFLAAPSLADDGVDDPDFDYLEPENRFFGAIRSFGERMFSTPQHPQSYQEAKRRMYSLLADETSLYCGCPNSLSARTFNAQSCGYVPRNNNIRAERLEAEHVVPAYWIANFHNGPNCWQKDPSCGSARECCLANDARFERAHNDLVNLYPAIGELNADRSHYIFSILEGEDRAYGQCDFEVDRRADLAEPREDMRGDIARIYFYV